MWCELCYFYFYFSSSAADCRTLVIASGVASSAAPTDQPTTGGGSRVKPALMHISLDQLDIGQIWRTQRDFKFGYAIYLWIEGEGDGDFSMQGVVFEALPRPCRGHVAIRDSVSWILGRFEKRNEVHSWVAGGGDGDFWMQGVVSEALPRPCRGHDSGSLVCQICLWALLYICLWALLYIAAESFSMFD